MDTLATLVLWIIRILIVVVLINLAVFLFRLILSVIALTARAILRWIERRNTPAQPTATNVRYIDVKSRVVS